MKKGILLFFSLLSGLVLGAQDDAAGIKAEYERQVRYVGADGPGVETIINRWEAAAPDDPEAAVARFNYWLAKATVRTEVIVRPTKKYLGQNPVVTLKDSLGNDVNYFEDTVYDDAAFGEALKAVEKAISLAPGELNYRFYKITAVLDYEKESPDMAVEEMRELIDEYTSGRRDWTWSGQPADDAIFCQGIGEYCYRLFLTASPLGYEYFLEISEKMNGLYPDDTVFINNIGSYWQVAQGNSRKALRYYRKALKIDPEDYVANTNIRIIQSSQSRKGRPSK